MDHFIDFSDLIINTELLKIITKLSPLQIRILFIPLVMEIVVYTVFSLISSFFEVRFMCVSCMCAPKYDLFVPFPFNICLSGELEYSINSWGTISNILFHLLTYSGYSYLVIKSKFSPKVILIFNSAILILNVIILVWMYKTYSNL